MKTMKKLSAAVMACAVVTAALPLSAVSAADTTEVTYAATITLNGTSATAEGEHVSVDGAKVTINASGAYLISGTLEDGQIIVNVPDTTADPETVKLFFNGVNVTGKTDAALYVMNAENTSVNLMDGTENFLSDGDAVFDATATASTAVVYAKDDITFKSGGELGSGKLTVTANANYGIHCNDDLKFTGGDVKVKTETEDGVRGKKSVTIKDGKLDVNAGGDGVKSTKGDVVITGGDTEIKAGNDAVQGEISVQISGGSLKANGDRGLTNANTAAGNAVTITGGTVFATATEVQATVANNTQPVLLFQTAEEQVKDQRIELIRVTDGGSETDPVFSKNPNKKFSYVLVSDPALQAEESYTLQIGGNPIKSYTFNEETVSGSTITLTDSITAVSNVIPGAAAAEEANMDINEDGDVDVSDAVILARFIAEDSELIMSPVAVSRADCDRDGRVTSNDVILILKKIAHLL
ncbi:MAG TPA: hypothetical protein DCG49_12250 [Ruminococcus sp.]|nr:hypothetical protein [Ruminococcus sp.]